MLAHECTWNISDRWQWTSGSGVWGIHLRASVNFTEEVLQATATKCKGEINLKYI